MAIPLKQSTASQEIILGYFLDTTDGNTAETGLTIANTDIRLWKHGTTGTVSKNSGGATHISDGLYYCILDDTDTDTLGSLIVFAHVTGSLAIRTECIVYPANVYDSLFAGTDALDVNVVGITGTTANVIADHTIRRGFANAADSSDGDTKAFRSLLGAIAKLVNKIEASGGTLTIYEEDDTTSLGTQTITSDAGANPITILDTD